MLALPGVVATPEICPVAVFSVNPAGRLPPVIAHEYGKVPPVAVSDWPYELPFDGIAGNEVVVIVGLLNVAMEYVAVDDSP
jgi:hypothetical protein